MVYDHHAILRRVHVELDGVGAELDRLLERRKGVFRLRPMRAAMGDLLGCLAPTVRQELLRVLVLGTMSAKLRGGPKAGQSAVGTLTAAGSERLPDEAP
jgi:hypothetical protein